MAGCGYVCPQCEGKGWLDNGEDCDYCTAAKDHNNVSSPDDKEEWIKMVHEGPCCADHPEEKP